MQAASNPCLDDNTLADFKAGRLDRDRTAMAELHLRTCPACSARLQAPASPPDLPAELLALSEYTDFRLLGSGNMGEVYLATNRTLNRQVALKLVQRQWLTRPDIVDRFLREIRAAARLSHRHVVTAYTVHEKDGNLILAMEYMPGGSLREALKRGPMKVREACRYAYHAALGLQHAHSKGLVHRDVKPDNLMLTLDDTNKPLVKVGDFGLAKAVNETDDGAHRTGTGMPLGTPYYMAPEQTSDAKKADIRADIYSLGCTLFHFLIGRPPFDAASTIDVLIHHRMTPVPVPSILRPEVSAELSAILQKMMAKAPADRYQTPAEVAQVLKPFSTRLGSASRPPSSVQTVQLPPLRSLEDTWVSTSRPPIETQRSPIETPKSPIESPYVSSATGMKFVHIPAGTFLMGSPDSDKDAYKDEKPQHRVSLTKDFLLGVYPVTCGQFWEFAEATRFTDYDWRSPGFPQTDDHPVVNVSWVDAVAFARWLSNKDGRAYRLPTEAEWEYACRAGHTSKYHFGDGLAQLPRYANFNGDRGGTTQVHKFPANPFGLHDMHGNVWEWCADWWADKYLPGDAIDPTGPDYGSVRVSRGGGWNLSAGFCRSAIRGGFSPVYRVFSLGFRLCRSPSGQ